MCRHHRLENCTGAVTGTNPAGMGTDIKKNPAVMTITGMIFAVIPQERDKFYVEYREH